MLEDLLSLVSSSPNLLRSKVQAEIQRLVDKGFIESTEAEVLKQRFLDEVHNHSDKGVAFARELGSIGTGLGSSVGSVIRDVLDLPSASELRRCLAEIEELVKESKRQQSGNLDTPVFNPGHRDDPGQCFEVLPGIVTWSRFVEDRGLYFNSYIIDHHGQKFVVDPVDPGSDKNRNLILENGPFAGIVVTNRNHIRATQWLVECCHCPVIAHQDEVIEDVEIQTRVVDNEEIAAGLRVIALPGKSAGEIALFREADGGQLFVGDALIGAPVGSLSILPEEKLDDPRQLRRSLRNLLDESFDTLFVGDGVSILADASHWTHTFLRSI